MSDPRPEPPATLSAEAKQTWRDVTGAFRSDWFSGNEAVLVAYCETAALERNLAGMLAQIETGSRQWRQMIRLYLETVSALISVATKLRLTPQSSRREQTAKLGSLGSRPWADDDSLSARRWPREDSSVE
jgi:phage terminase small subunit